ncbi:dihydrofolate reductase family protein [Alkalihalobacillus sp. TS-13]|uniref:dihydrofolate reductase family protein n=1 Tax=Alkalihalobacillus sp. TS-13 TaxID=2842455 RepID=UPI0021AA19E3|nr:dihydrofolate reductase family protein [Alkalihalobacillus sp. TS-13]
MGKVVLDMSMSLDGFIAGPNDNDEQPLGVGGDILHSWLFTGNHPSKHNDFFKLSQKSREVFDESFETTGAIIVGRRTFDVVQGWGGNHPVHGATVVVVTHHPPDTPPEGSTPFIFVTDGIERAVEQAKAAAGKKNVGVGTANVAHQCLKDGQIDEIPASHRTCPTRWRDPTVRSYRL